MMESVETSETQLKNHISLRSGRALERTITDYDREKPHDVFHPAIQWCRICMDQGTSAMVSKLEFSKYKALEISGNKWENFSFNSYISTSYPDFDICRDVFPEKFDIIISEQVFEHIPFPSRAARNIYKMLNPGGFRSMLDRFFQKGPELIKQALRATVSLRATLLALGSQTAAVWYIRLMLGPQQIEQ